MRVNHQTVQVERVFRAPVAQVFRAWTTSEALSRWYVPGDADWNVTISDHNFAVGGRKHLLFGPPGEPPYAEDCRYEDIVPEQRIVYTMTISNGQSRQTASLVTVEFLSGDHSTTLLMTDQLAILDGGDTAGAREKGWGEVFDKLALEFS